MHLVKNKFKYWEYIRSLRNDPLIKDGFLVQDYITDEQQRDYMRTHNDDYYICLNVDMPVGYIGAVDNDIRLAVELQHQRKGVGAFMLTEFMKINPQARAKVKIDNITSQSLFERCGFTCTSRDQKFYYYDFEID